MKIGKANWLTKNWRSV